ncbi:MAG: MATE family efflux transporter [Clostridia bacterium]|nr:MATE family efflux transporter [Clostridia bacterium]
MKLFKDRYFYKSFFSMASVIILQNLLIYSVNLADNIMIGNYSETAMNGVSLANQIQFLLQMFAMGAANGLSVLASQYWGKKETDPIKKIFSSACIFGLGMSLLLAVFVITMPDTALGLLTDKQDAIAEGSKYIVIMGFTYCIYTLTNMFLAMLRSVETVKIGFAVTAVSLTVNISLNYCLIFGKLGFPELGVRGAAYATLTARVVELIIVAVYVFRFDKKIRFRFRDFFVIEKAYLRDYVKAGLPLIGSATSWGIAMAVQTAIIGRLDSAAVLGANNIATTIHQVVSVFYGSTSNSASVIIGKTVGEHDYDRVKIYAKRLQIIFLITGLISGAIMFLLCDSVVSMYDIAPDTAQLAKIFIYILSVTIIGSNYEAPALCGIVSGGGDTKFVLYNDLIFMWGIVLPLSALSAFVFNFPIPVTFFLLKSDQILKCFVAVFKVNRFRWIKELTRS